MSVFDRQEFHARLARVKARMAQAGIDVLIAADPANINYLTGYDGWSFYVHQYAVLRLDADEPLWVGRAMDAPGARMTAFLDPANIIAYPETYVDSDVLHPAQFLVRTLRESGCGSARIGTDFDTFYFTAKDYLELVRELPNAHVVDAKVL
ncbi:MAG: aminopeptidase P family N-terminal domain-containing protein [Rhizobiaceae bacterium]